MRKFTRNAEMKQKVKDDGKIISKIIIDTSFNDAKFPIKSCSKSYDVSEYLPDANV